MTLTRGASVEQQDDATFKFKLSTHSEFGGASHCITGTILVGGKTVGSIEGTLVDRDFIRRFGANGGPGTRTTFRMVCDEVSDELQKVSENLFDVDGRCDLKRMYKSKAWSWDADEGGLVHIDTVMIDKAHRGRELGLQALRHLLNVKLKEKWTLTIISPFPIRADEEYEEEDDISREFFMAQMNGYPLTAEMKKQLAEIDERDDLRCAALARYFARMGFTQADFDFWFLAAGKPMSRPRAQCDALPVLLKPMKRHLPEAEERLVAMAQAPDPIQAADIEALVAQGASLHRASPLHHCVGARNLDHIPAFLAAGCNINDKDILGYTPLHVATSVGSAEERVKATAALMTYGADPRMRDALGETPLESIVSKEEKNSQRLGTSHIDSSSSAIARLRAMLVS